MKRVFISHAATDKELVDGFVDLLDTGTALNQTDIFCSSVKGMGVPNYKEFVETIKKQLEEAQLVIVILSPNFIESSFCNCELGATWFTAKECFVLVLPPLKYEDIKGVMTGKHVGMITDSSVLDELRDYLKVTLSVDAATARWNEKKIEFLSSVGKRIKSSKKPEGATLASSKELNSSSSPVIDVPNQRDSSPIIDFAELNYSFVQLFPLLYWLDRVVPAKYAGAYLDRMQRVFNLSNGVLNGTDENLIIAVDNLLRVLSQIQISEGYCHGKMCTAFNRLETYMKAHGEVLPSFMDGEIRDLAHEARGTILIYLGKNKKIEEMDFLIIRLMEALLSYFDSISRDTLYKDVERDVQHSLRVYLEKGLRLNNNISLPGISDVDNAKTLQGLCEYKWGKSVEIRKGERFKDKYVKGGTQGVV